MVCLSQIEDVNDENVDEAGLEAKDIELVKLQTGVSRAKAVKKPRKR